MFNSILGQIVITAFALVGLLNILSALLICYIEWGNHSSSEVPQIPRKEITVDGITIREGGYFLDKTDVDPFKSYTKAYVLEIKENNLKNTFVKFCSVDDNNEPSAQHSLSASEFIDKYMPIDICQRMNF